MFNTLKVLNLQITVVDHVKRTKRKTVMFVLFSGAFNINATWYGPGVSWYY